MPPSPARSPHPTSTVSPTCPPAAHRRHSGRQPAPRWDTATRKAHLITADSALRTTIAPLLNHRVELTTLNRLRPATTDVTTVATKRTTALALLGIGMLAYMQIDELTWLDMMILLPLAAFESHHALPAAFSHPTQRILAMTRKSASETAPVTPPGNAEPEITITGTTTGQPAVSVHNLVPRPGDPAWNFDVGFGQCAVIKAPSGYGKTSLLEVIAGALTHENDTPWCQLVHLHEEDEWIFATTVRENLVVANTDRNDCEEACDAVGFPLPLDTVLADGDKSLSSGQRRHLILARVLLAPTPSCFSTSRPSTSTPPMPHASWRCSGIPRRIRRSSSSPTQRIWP